MLTPQLICLLGAECTGKTTLARGLAQHFNGLWVPEYLRTFCEEQGRPPKVDEQGLVMHHQFEQEELTLAQARQAGCTYVFCDTTPLLTAIYSDFYFADSALHGSAQAMQSRYALTLLLSPDLPWTPDGVQRDGPKVRAAVHARLLHELQIRHYPHIEVSGAGATRLHAAVLAVETLSG
jgi:nicotinamide riboside kinase